MVKNIFIRLISAILIVLTLGSGVWAQTGNKTFDKSLNDAANKAKADVNKSVNDLKKDAQKKANQALLLLQDFTLLMRSLASYESPFEDFADIFRTNSCQNRDITSIQQQMDGVRKAVRQFAIKGDKAGFDQFKKEMLFLAVELQFVRNMVDTTFGSFVVKDQTELANRIAVDFSVTSDLTEEEILNYASGLLTKYEGHIKAYRECNEFGEWKQVVERVEKLSKSLKESTQALGETATEPFTRNTTQAQTAGRSTDVVKHTAKGGVLKYFQEHVAVNVGIPASLENSVKDTITRVQTAVNQSTAQVGGDSINKLQQDIINNQYVINVSKEVADKRARYDLRYGEVGDAALTEILAEVDRMNAEIKKAHTTLLPKTLNCLQVPNGKQCADIK